MRTPGYTAEKSLFMGEDYRGGDRGARSNHKVAVPQQGPGSTGSGGSGSHTGPGVQASPCTVTCAPHCQHNIPDGKGKLICAEFSTEFVYTRCCRSLSSLPPATDGVQYYYYDYSYGRYCAEFPDWFHGAPCP